MDKCFLKATLKQWQKVLRLQDWRISIRYAETFEFRSPERFAELRPEPRNKSAKIWILSPEDERFQELSIDADDITELIIHELLHLHFLEVVPEDRSKTVDNAFECALNMLTVALSGRHAYVYEEDNDG